MMSKKTPEMYGYRRWFWKWTRFCAPKTKTKARITVIRTDSSLFEVGLF